MENVKEENAAAASVEDSKLRDPTRSIRLMKEALELSGIEYYFESVDGDDNNSVEELSRVEVSDDETYKLVKKTRRPADPAIDQHLFLGNCRWVKERYGAPGVSQDKDPICKRKSKSCKKLRLVLQANKIGTCARFPLILSFVAQVGERIE